MKKLSALSFSLLLISAISITGIATLECTPSYAEGWTTMPTTGVPLSYLYGIWGSSSSNIYAVGIDATGGTIIRYNGIGWSKIGSPSETQLNDVWVSPTSDIFTVGDGGTIFRSTNNGDTWPPMSSGTTEDLYDIWGTASNNVYAVGFNGTILRYDGSSWKAIISGTTHTFNGIWGSSDSSVFVVGSTNASNGVILRYYSGTWSEVATSSKFLKGIWGTDADIFAVGDEGTILRSGSPMGSGTASNLNDVWGTSSSNVYAVGFDSENNGTILHYDGSSWQATSMGSLLLGIWGSSESDIYAVGFITESGENTILHYSSGTTPTPTIELTPTPTAESTPTPTAESTPTPTSTATPTPTVSSASTSTPTISPSPSVHPTSTPTATSTATTTSTPTHTPTATPTLIPTKLDKWYNGTPFGVSIAAILVIVISLIFWQAIRQRRSTIPPKKNP